jgi:hypothetical protein
MPFLLYFAVVVVSVFGILLEADVLVEPARKVETVVDTPLHRAPPPVAQQSPAPADRLRAAAPASPAAAPAAPVKAAVAPTQPALPAEASAADHCDVAACETAYHSFRATDCTYQPTDGPRRLCSKGAPAAVAAEAAAPEARTDGNAAQGAACNADACAAAYGSFNPADCTYQPYDGPRRLCTK